MYGKNQTPRQETNRNASDKGSLFQILKTSLVDNFYNRLLDRTTDGSFKAVCLSGIRTEDNTGISLDEHDALLREDGFLEITIRPLESTLFETLPDIIGSQTLDELISLIAVHTSVFTAKSDFKFENTNMPQFGQIINCYFEKGSIRNSDFSGLRFSKIEDAPEFHDDYLALATQESKNSAKNAFAAGGAALLGALPSTNEILIESFSDGEIDDLAERFDSDSTPNKANNSSLINDAHPEFQKYIKAFIVVCADYDIAIQINSTYRNRASQQSLIDKYEAKLDKWTAGGKQGKKPIEPAKESYHISGLAFDFNPILSNGTKISSSMSKEIWLQSGVVKIGESLNLRWGGNFKGNYDPIHFDFGNVIDKKRNREIIKEASRKNVEATTIKIGIEEVDDQYGESSTTESSEQ